MEKQELVSFSKTSNSTCPLDLCYFDSNDDNDDDDNNNENENDDDKDDDDIDDDNNRDVMWFGDVMIMVVK